MASVTGTDFSEPTRTVWLTERRVVSWAAVLLCVELSFLGFLALWQHGVFGAQVQSSSSDFVSFFAAGKLALAGMPASAYDRIAHQAAEYAATQPGIPYQYFFYPPVYLLICAPLALAPYGFAFALFQVTTLIACLLVASGIVGSRRWDLCVPMLAFPSALWNLGLGQNAFLSTALFGGFTLMLDRRPIVAGILLGSLCYKPHLALLAPVALVSGNRWKTIMAAIATVGLLAGFSVLFFGVDTWTAYVSSAIRSRAMYESGRIDFAGFISPFGAARLLGISPASAWIVQIATTVTAAATVWWIWRRNTVRPVRSAALAAGAVLAAPIALVYDYLFCGLAILWLARNGRDHGFLPGEKLLLVITFVIPLLSWQIGRMTGVALGPVGAAILLLLCVVHANPQAKARGNLP